MSDTECPAAENYFDSHYIATISIVGDGFKVIGSNAERKALNEAKSETNYCFVKDLESKRSVKLILKKRKWILDPAYELES
jgi:hypothetical protein